MGTILNVGVITASIVLTLAVGLEVDRSAIREAIRLRVRLLVFWTLQFLVPPVVALLIVRTLDLPLHIQAGLLLLAACPVGDIANAYTLLARGPVACSLAVNALSCLAAPLTMALTFAVYEVLLGDAFSFAIPTPALVVRVFFLAVIPVVIGASWRALHPVSANRFRPRIRQVCIGCIVVLILYVLSTQWENVMTDTGSSMVTAGAFLGVTLAVGWWIGRGMKMTMPERACGAVLIGVRNLGMMAAVAIVMLGRTDYAVFGAFYFVVQVVLALSLVGWTLRRADGRKTS
jgi:bile acid:Na+ symporter, BASS family